MEAGVNSDSVLEAKPSLGNFTHIDYGRRRRGLTRFPLSSTTDRSVYPRRAQRLGRGRLVLC